MLRSLGRVFTSRTHFVLIVVLISLLLAVLPAAADGEKPGAPTGATTDYVDIASAGPLTHIYLGVDASAQIAHTGDTDLEVYPEDTIPGDYGTFLAVGGVLYAPDFDSHGSTATGNLNTYTTFTPVSQTGVTGAGTPADPYEVTTVVDVGTTGLQVTQIDSYIVGSELYRTDVVVSNAGTAPIAAILYRAMDCYLGG
jgi:hypothetical protein